MPIGDCEQQGKTVSFSIPCPGDINFCCLSQGDPDGKDCQSNDGQCQLEQKCNDNGGNPLTGVSCPGNLVCCSCQEPEEPDITEDECQESGGWCVPPKDCDEEQDNQNDNGIQCPDDQVCCVNDCILAGGDTCTDLPSCTNLGGTVIDEPDIACPGDTKCCKGVGTQYDLLTLKVNTII